MNQIVESLKVELSGIPFFSRVFHNNDKKKLIIWNDIDIKRIYPLDAPVDINHIMAGIKNDIEEKYKIINQTVSIIIPNYNNSYFIKEVIERILKNTYKNTFSNMQKKSRT